MLGITKISSNWQWIFEDKNFEEVNFNRGCKALKYLTDREKHILKYNYHYIHYVCSHLFPEYFVLKYLLKCKAQIIEGIDYKPYARGFFEFYGYETQDSSDTTCSDTNAIYFPRGNRFKFVATSPEKATVIPTTTKNLCTKKDYYFFKILFSNDIEEVQKLIAEAKQEIENEHTNIVVIVIKHRLLSWRLESIDIDKENSILCCLIDTLSPPEREEPFMYACCSNNIIIVKYLLEKGFKITLSPKGLFRYYSTSNLEIIELVKQHTPYLIKHKDFEYNPFWDHGKNRYMFWAEDQHED
jgi:hypothetical protein